jgi:integrase
MASIKPRGKTWSYSVSLGTDPITKKQIQKTKSGFASRSEAKKAADELEYKFKLERGKLLSKRNKFSEVVEDWLSTYEQGVKKSTLNIRKKAINKIIPIWGNQKVDAITNTTYQVLMTSLSRDYSKNYVDSIHHTLSQVFKFAKRRKLIYELPCLDITFRKRYDDDDNENLENFLERNELADFLELAKNSKNYDDYFIFFTLALTGLRIGELMALQWKNINFETNTLHVTHTLYNPNNNSNTYELTLPKTKKSKRTIQIADSLLVELIKYKAHVEKEFKKQASTNFVFFKDNYKPLTNTFVRNRLKAILGDEKKDKEEKRYGKNITLHSFRHTFASLLIEYGMSVMDVAELLGHSDTTITMKIYTHVTTKRQLEMQETLSKFADTI